LELLRARAAHGSRKTKISLTELAKRVNEPRSTIHAYVTGRYLAPPDVLDRIVAELGAAPAELREWSEAWFRVSADRHALRHAKLTPGTPVRTPHELPTDVPGFTGRIAELDQLNSLLAGAGRGASAVVISAVAGTAGVGKTALAVHWGHAAAKSFPDGSLYVDLRGYDPDEPMHPGDALAGFLRALGVDGIDIPYEPTERAARYRTLVEGRRMLILLDNAKDTEQVRPLLPGTTSCLVVVTSRDRLAGLVARHGAHRIDLDLLPPDDATALLRKLIGARVDTDPAATDTLTAHCARLPLALRIAAELAVARPATTLADLADELADGHRKLELLDAGNDPRTAVRSVFSWSYQHLTAEAASLFRLLGVHPGADVNTHATAALADISNDRASRLLHVLANAHLVQATTPSRYRMHDLLRTWARECAMATEPESDHRAALTRLLDHYLHTASTAVDLLYPYDRNRRPPTPVPARVTLTLSDEESARRWLTAERANLLAITAHAARNGWPGHAIQLSVILHRHLLIAADVTDTETMHQLALAAALQHGDRTDQARAVHNLGSALAAAGQFEHAIHCLQQALASHRDVGDQAGEARALSSLGTSCWRSGQYQQATHHLQRALALYRDVGDPAGEARALLNLGATYWRSGQYAQSAHYFRQTETRCRAIDIRDGHILALCGIGAAYWRSGQYKRAADYLRRALILSSEFSDRYGESVALTHLGIIYGRTDRHEQAIEHLQQAVTLCCDIGDRDGQAEALTHLGDVYSRMAQHEPAITCHQEALRLFHDCGDRGGLASASNGLGETACAAGDPIHALRAHESAHEYASQIGDRLQLARAYSGAGNAQHLLGKTDEAHTHWRQALALYNQLGVPETAEVRAHLTEIDDHAKHPQRTDP
jgi:tetratricopeptide (TPR) repeat protein